MVNRRQARYILHNINEVSRILQTGLGREQFADVPTTTRGVNADDETMRGRLSALVMCLTNVIYRHCVQYIPVILVICLVTECFSFGCDNYQGLPKSTEKYENVNLQHQTITKLI